MFKKRHAGPQLSILCILSPPMSPAQRLLRRVPQLARALPISSGWSGAPRAGAAAGRAWAAHAAGARVLPALLLREDRQQHFPACSWQKQCRLLSPDPGFRAACRNFPALKNSTSVPSTKKLHGQTSERAESADTQGVTAWETTFILQGRTTLQGPLEQLLQVHLCFQDSLMLGPPPKHPRFGLHSFRGAEDAAGHQAALKQGDAGAAPPAECPACRRG